MVLLQIWDELRLFGIKIINPPDFFELVIRFGFDLFITYMIVKVIYYSKYQRKDYLFTFFLFNILIFFLCYLLNSVKLSIGFAFGLFAVFAILRYRTLPISIKEMSYLFIIIGIAVMNAISNKKISYAEVIFTNFAIVAVTYFL